MRKILILVGLLALTSCASLPTLAPVPIYIHVCPVAPAYTPAFEKAAGMQLQGLPAGSPDVKMLEDYLTVRAEIGACNK